MPIRISPLGVVALAGALWGAAAAAQSLGPEAVVQAPAFVVQGAAPPGGAAGASLVALDPMSQGGLDDWDALNRAAANFHVEEGGAGGFGSLFDLRGLVNTPYFSEPSVTVYFADIPLASSFTYPEALASDMQAEVLAGPQGTEFGRATDGGVIEFEPLDHGASGGGLIAAGAGAYSERDGAVSAASASGAPVAAIADAAYEARRGYIFNAELGRPVDDLERENAFAQVRAQAAPNLRLTAEAFGSRERDGAQPLVPLGGPLFEVSRPSEGVTDLDSWGAALKGELDLPAATVVSITSVTDWRMNPYTDYLVLPPPLASLLDQDEKAWNEEVRVTSAQFGPVQAYAGLWLSKSTTDNFVDRSIAGAFPIEVSGFEQGGTSAAAFADAILTPAPGWQLTAGLRAETDRKRFFRDETVPVAGLDYGTTGRYDAILPKLALRWTPAPGEHAEASVRWGLRPGGFSSYTDNPALMPFPAERLVAYSGGWDWTDPRRRLDAAIRGFYDVIDDYQIERSFTATDYFVATAARAHTAGAEVEGRWHPADGWTLGATAGETQATLDRYVEPITGEALAGARAPYVPRFTADLELAYQPARGWFAATDLEAVGRTDFDELGTPADVQGGYATWGARAGYAAGRWTMTAYGENLLNRGYYTLIVPGVASGAPGAPRTYGVELERRF